MRPPARWAASRKAGAPLHRLAGVGTVVAISAARSDTTVTTVPASTMILVAARETPPGTVIAAGDFRSVEISSDGVPPSALRANKLSDLVGKVTTATIAKGELIPVA